MADDEQKHSHSGEIISMVEHKLGKAGDEEITLRPSREQHLKALWKGASLPNRPVVKRTEKQGRAEEARVMQSALGQRVPERLEVPAEPVVFQGKPVLNGTTRSIRTPFSKLVHARLSGMRERREHKRQDRRRRRADQASVRLEFFGSLKERLSQIQLPRIPSPTFRADDLIVALQSISFAGLWQLVVSGSRRFAQIVFFFMKRVDVYVAVADDEYWQQEKSDAPELDDPSVPDDEWHGYDAAQDAEIIVLSDVVKKRKPPKFWTKQSAKTMAFVSTMPATLLRSIGPLFRRGILLVTKVAIVLSLAFLAAATIILYAPRPSNGFIEGLASTEMTMVALMLYALWAMAMLASDRPRFLARSRNANKIKKRRVEGKVL